MDGQDIDDGVLGHVSDLSEGDVNGSALNPQYRFVAITACAVVQLMRTSGPLRTRSYQGLRA